MSNTYSWDIDALVCYPEHQGLENVVFNVAWRRYVEDETGNEVELPGEQAITLDAGANFTPYRDLTVIQVVGWVEAALGEERIAELDAELANRLANKIKPQVVIQPLPW